MTYRSGNDIKFRLQYNFSFFNFQYANAGGTKLLEMEKQLFNEEGLQKLQEHLYGLENQELEREMFELEENIIIG